MKYYYGDYVKEGEIGRTCRAHGIYEKCIDPCRILVGDPQEKRLLGRARLTWEGNNEMCHK
jgi:hypothetical protein